MKISREKKEEEAEKTVKRLSRHKTVMLVGSLQLLRNLNATQTLEALINKS